MRAGRKDEFIRVAVSFGQGLGKKQVIGVVAPMEVEYIVNRRKIQSGDNQADYQPRMC